MTLRKSMSAVFAFTALATALFLSSCNDTTTTPVAFVPSAPSNLKAMSINDSTIRIMFDASSSESNTGFKKYMLTAVSGTATTTFEIPKGSGSPGWVELHPLAAGKSWTMSLVAVGDSNSSAATLTWATATRYPNLRAYSAASDLGSGLNLKNGTQLTIKAADEWDLCFDTNSGSINFGSPSLSGYTIGTPRNTYFFGPDTNSIYNIPCDSLNFVFDSYALNDPNGPRKSKFQTQFDVAGSQGFVCYCLTQDNNFAKIFIKSAGGKIVQHDSHGDYVEVDASVQRTSLIPYALKQNMGFDGPGTKATHVLKISATK